MGIDIDRCEFCGEWELKTKSIKVKSAASPTIGGTNTIRKLTRSNNRIFRVLVRSACERCIKQFKFKVVK